MAQVKLEGVRKVYDNGHVAVHGVDLVVGDGEFVVLVGPSGCGKSTTLRMVAGLETITDGRLLIGDRLVNDVQPKDRDIAMVFQSYALYPHMSVYDNMAFALKLRRMPKAEVDKRVREAAAILGLETMLDRLPRQLSGGQRQRVAIGRAIVRQPAVFLFDEPLSNLDAKLRVQTRREIARLHRQLAATVLYVTHDQVEAMTLGDRIVVLNEGHVQQVDTPMGLYERPRNVFVATFIGSPAMNLVRGALVRGDGGPRFVAEGDALALAIPPGRVAALGDVPAGDGRPVVLGVRPEHLVPVRGEDPRLAAVPLRLDAVEPLGNEVLLYGRLGAAELTARVAPGSRLPAPGETIALAPEPAHLHLFDAATGLAIGDGTGAPREEPAPAR